MPHCLALPAWALDFPEWLPALPTWSWALIGVAVFIIGLLYVIGPALLKQHYRVPARPAFELVDRARQQLPASVDAFFRDVETELADAGFSEVACLFHLAEWFQPDAAVEKALGEIRPRVMSVMAILGNPAAQETAMAVAIYAQGGERATPKLGQTYLEFSTEYDDGSEVCTNNSSQLRIFPDTPGSIVVELPEVESPARLYHIHGLVTARHGDKRKVFRLADEDVAAYMRGCFAREHARAAEVGYTFLDEAAGVFRPTWKGAVLMTWKVLWPWSSIQRAGRRRRTKRLLREVGM